MKLLNPLAKPAKLSLARSAGCLLSLALSACVGAVSGPPQPGSGSPGGTPTGNKVGTAPNGSPSGSGGSSGGVQPGNGGAGVALTCVTPAIGATALRRLTHREYDNAMADLLGVTTNPSESFPDDISIGLFDNTAEAQGVPVLLAGEYVDAAVKLANGVTNPNLTTLVGCDFTGTAGGTCVRTFIQRFGRRAFRRPVTTDETTRLAAIYDKALTDKQTGVRAVLAAMLVSPHFLFRPEFGTMESTIPGTNRLTQFEQAGRLASLLWASVPDDVLLDEAQAGRLATRDQIATQARRMLTDPRARRAIATFYDQWLGLQMLDVANKDSSVYMVFDDVLRTSMRQETQRFVASVLWDGDSRLSTLLSASYSFINAPLAALYGVKGPADAATYSKVMLDPTQRVGLLTQASFLSAFARPDSSSPVKRGVWIRKRLLCGDLPDPPANVPELPAIQDGVSNRERFSMHTSVPFCATCHSMIDGLGLGLEAYDGIGQYQTTDRGIAIDTSGEVTATTDINGKYNGAIELSARLASSAQVRDCAPTQWLRYALARREGPDDSCTLKAVRDGFATSGGNLRELMVMLTQTDAFTNYKPAN